MLRVWHKALRLMTSSGFTWCSRFRVGGGSQDDGSFLGGLGLRARAPAFRVLRGEDQHLRKYLIESMSIMDPTCVHNWLLSFLCKHMCSSTNGDLKPSKYRIR